MLIKITFLTNEAGTVGVPCILVQLYSCTTVVLTPDHTLSADFDLPTL